MINCFFETLMMEIRGETISYSSFKKKQENKRQDIIQAEIRKLEKENNINYSVLERKKQELLELRTKKMQGVFIRSRAKWITDGEKPSNYFCNLENRNFTSKLMNSLYADTGTLLTNQSDILNEVCNHYKNLYSSRDTDNINLTTLFNNSDSIPKLNEYEKQSLEGHLSYNEMLTSLKKMSNDSSPGSSGFTAAFYKFFWIDIGHFLVRSINHAFDTGELSITLKQGVITCIPKGNKDKRYIKNWRPISLLNTAYKIASASIAQRLKTVLNKLISEDQTGFLPERYIGDNIRLFMTLCNIQKNIKYQECY